MVTANQSLNPVDAPNSLAFRTVSWSTTFAGKSAISFLFVQLSAHCSSLELKRFSVQRKEMYPRCTHSLCQSNSRLRYYHLDVIPCDYPPWRFPSSVLVRLCRTGTSHRILDDRKTFSSKRNEECLDALLHICWSTPFLWQNTHETVVFQICVRYIVIRTSSPKMTVSSSSANDKRV